MIALLGVLLAGTVAPIGNGNALTLPAARHLVRMDTGGGRPPAWLLAIQQDGAGGRGLWFLRSDDGGASWSSYAPIQGDRTERDTPDLVALAAGARVRLALGEHRLLPRADRAGFGGADLGPGVPAQRRRHAHRGDQRQHRRRRDVHATTVAGDAGKARRRAPDQPWNEAPVPLRDARLLRPGKDAAAQRR